LKEIAMTSADATELATAEETPSLHQRILADISEKIMSGEWAPGYRIPFEYELAVEYGCSRMTVNKAMTQLARAGLIERRRRSGSFVLRPKSQAAILEIHDIKAEVQALGLPYRFELTRKQVRAAADDDRERLGLSEAARMVEVTCLHFAGVRPFCHESRLINLSAVPEAEAESFSETSPGPWLVGHIPWSVAEHRIRAAAADAEIAAALGIAKRSPCLVVERQTWTADQPVTHVRFTYAGDSHTLIARFTPSQG
jgi:GntR family transcriptional regulator, histidine utilization repressor